MRNYLVRKDIANRKLFFLFEKKKKMCKLLRQNVSLDSKKRNYFSKMLHVFPKKSSKSFIKNTCIISHRSRSVYRDFRLTRIQLRELAGFGFLTGIRKASW